MSLIDRQALTITSVAHGAMKSATEMEIGPQFRALAEAAERALLQVGEQWVTDDPRLLQFVGRAMRLWGRREPRVETTSWRLIELTSLSITAITDLDERLAWLCRRRQDHQHLAANAALLQPLFPALNAVLEYLDPQGDRYADHVATDRMLRQLYEVIEW